MLSTLMGKCSSHLASVSNAEGHSVQKADGREKLIRPSEQVKII